MRTSVALLSLLLAIPLLAQEDAQPQDPPEQQQEGQIFRTVDEHGNVTFTDQPPEEGAEPVDLPPVQVADPAPAFERPARPARSTAQRAPRRYTDLSIVSPEADQHFWGTGGTVPVTLNTADDLDPRHRVRCYIGDELKSTVGSLQTTLSGVFRGQHSLRCDIVDGRNQVLASAGPVIFHMRQASRN